MATTVDSVVLVFTARGVQRVARQIGNVGAVASGTRRTVNLLTASLAGLSAVFAIRKVATYADSFTDLQNRLRLVRDTTEQVTQTTTDLFDIANKTRANIEETGRVFFRFARANDTIGASQKELLTVTEAINQAVAVSGTSAQSAASALFQFSQGIAANSLRGQELNSVLEQIPGLAEALAKGIGKNVGDLRALAEQGFFTSKVVFDALLKQAPDLAAQFAKVAPTISQAFEVLRTETIRFIGELDTANGVSGAFAKAVIFLANNLDVVAKSLISVAAGFAVAFAPAVVKSINAVTSALARNPLGALAIALTTVITALTLFREEIVVIKDGAVTLGTVVETIFGNLATIFEMLSKAAGDLGESIGDKIGSAFSNLGITAASGTEAVLQVLRGFANVAIGIFSLPIRLFIRAWFTVPDALRDGSVRVQNVFRGLAAAAGKIFADLGNAIVRTLFGAFNKVIGFANSAFDKLDIDISIPEIEPPSFANLLADFETPLENKFEGALETLRSGFAETIKDTFSIDFVGQVGDAIDFFSSEVIDPFISQLKEAQKAKDALNKPTAVPDDTGGGGGATETPSIGKDLRNDVQSLIDQFTPLEEKIRDSLDLIELVRTQFPGAFDNDELERAFQGLQAQLQALDPQFKKIVEFGTAAADALQSSFADFFFDPFEEGLRGLATSFVDSMRRIISEAIALEATLATLKVVQGLFAEGGATSKAIGSIISGISGSQFGQTAIAKEPRLVGEDGPEIIVPQSRSGVLTNDTLRRAGSGTSARLEGLMAQLITVTQNKELSVVNINEQDPKAILPALRTREGVKLQRNFVATDQRTIKDTLGVR